MSFKNAEKYYVWLNTIIVFLASCLLFKTTPPTTITEGAYYSLSLFAHISILLYIIYLPFYLLPLNIKKWLLPILFSCFTLLIIVDTQIYGFFRFHINLMAWNVITTKGGWGTLGISNTEILIYSLIATVFIVLQYLLFFVLLKKIQKPFYLKNYLLALGITQIIGVSIYAYSDLYDINSFTKVFQIVPYYQPLTVKRTYFKIYGVLPTPQIKISIAQSGGLIYPLRPLDWKIPEKKYNFIFIVIDCFRLKSFNEEITPNIWKFSKASQTFVNHYSGGNSTRNGVFSILYGVYSTYWDHFLRENRSPVFIDRLQELNYETHVFASTLQSFPEFKKTAFIKMNAFIKDEYPGQAFEKDKQVLDDIYRFAAKNRTDNKNFFSYSLLDGAHSTYSFPSAEAHYQPILNRVTYSTLSDEHKRIHMKNRYHNGLKYVDKQIGILLAKLKKDNLLENSIVVITGDHGDEFMEYGNIGHSNAFTPPQIQSPLIMYIPGKKGHTYKHLTNHNDIMATLLPMLGATNPTSDFSHGNNLFDTNIAKDTFVCSWDNCALVDKDGYMIFGTKSYNSHKVEFRDIDYLPISKKEGMLPDRMIRASKVLSKMSELLR